MANLSVSTPSYRGRRGLGIFGLVLWAAACGGPTPPPTAESLEVLSQVYTIDRKYRSMQGPSATVHLTMLPDEAPELIWITGYRARVVEPDGATPVPPEFMCHSNLSFDAAQHRELFGWSKHTADRLFTVSQGQTEIQLPEGFGIPLLSDEDLTLTTQVLNHNVPDTSMQVRVQVTIDFVRDSSLSQPFTPLYMKSANALVSLDGSNAYYGGASRGSHGAGSVGGMAASARVIHDRMGREFAGHWIVPPGRQETKTAVTNWMNLPGDSRVYYMATHLHPFAKALSLTDLTTGAVIFTSNAAGYPDKIGLSRVTSYADAHGLRLFGDHEYELTSVYDNTSGEAQEAMAVMYLYLLDEEFHRPGGQ